MIEELVEHGEHERSLTRQAREEAESILQAGETVAAHHYNTIVSKFKEEAREHKQERLEQTKEKIQTVQDEADNVRSELKDTRSDLQDHATAITDKLKAILDDNT